MKSGTIQFWETPGGNTGGFSFMAAQAKSKLVATHWRCTATIFVWQKR
jgi:hypothetical protein